MDERVTTRAEFEEEVRRLAQELGEVVWEEVVERAVLAGVLEPYAAGRDELLRRFAGVWVSVEKIERLVAQEGQRAQAFLREAPAGAGGAAALEAVGPCYVGIDGGMIFVEGR